MENKCKVCGNPCKRKYCSKKCSNKFFNRRNNSNKSANEKRAKYAPGKLKCPICGGYYYAMGHHARNGHKMSAREFKENYGYDVKKGVISEEYYEKIKIPAEVSIQNLKAGKKFWFRKRQEGLGKYERSEETRERLKHLHKLTKQYKKKYGNTTDNSVHSDGVWE